MPRKLYTFKSFCLLCWLAIDPHHSSVVKTQGNVILCVQKAETADEY